jgi:small subunit ribosomal protein S16
VIGLLKSAQRNNPSLLAGFALADSLPTAVLLDRLFAARFLAFPIFAILSCWEFVCAVAIAAAVPLNRLPKTSSFERISTVLMIRLARVGARKQPYYRVVVIEKDRARNGRSIEVVGTYNPRTNPASIDLKRERIDYWTSKGAQFSDRVAKLVAQQPAAVAAA